MEERRTAWLRNLVMMVSIVCSYSLRRRLSCLFSWRSVWFSMMICAFVRSSSDSNVSGAGCGEDASVWDRRHAYPSRYQCSLVAMRSHLLHGRLRPESLLVYDNSAIGQTVYRRTFKAPACECNASDIL